MKSYIISAAIAAMMLGISPALSAQTAANPEGTMIYALPKTTLTLKVTAEKDGKKKEFTTVCRADVPIEIEYIANGGILPFVLRRMIAE